MPHTQSDDLPIHAKSFGEVESIEMSEYVSADVLWHYTRNALSRLCTTLAFRTPLSATYWSRVSQESFQPEKWRVNVLVWARERKRFPLMSICAVQSQAKRTPFVSAWRDVSRSSSSKVQLSRHSHYAISKSVVVLPSLRARPESLIAHFGTPREIVRHDHFNNENINEPLSLCIALHYRPRHTAATWIIETWTAHAVHERDTRTHISHSVRNSPHLRFNK
jgi:hypothetical protein